MHSPKNPSIFILMLASSILYLGLAAFAQNDNVLFFFPGGDNGSQPWGNLVFDPHGNLYGTTSLGGTIGQGTVFELTPAAEGGWNESVIYSFGSSSSTDGAQPSGGLILDASGNLYGLTVSGGSRNFGTVYELSPATGGGWTETILYNFTGNTDVEYPNSSLVFDASGSLFGVSSSGGVNSMGGVFELSPETGSWTEKVILAGNKASGGNFLGPIVIDSHGALYAEAALSGAHNAGSVYRLALVSGNWRANVIHAFAGGNTDGNEPSGGLVIGPPNHISGVTQAGGTHGDGVAFQLVQTGTGTWSETILHNFGDTPTDGQNPQTNLTIGRLGRLYGTTFAGGTRKSGTVFILSPNGEDWTETTIHNFNSTTDVGYPGGGVTFDGSGNIYGMGHNGGSAGMGGVYELVTQ